LKFKILTNSNLLPRDTPCALKRGSEMSVIYFLPRI